VNVVSQTPTVSLFALLAACGGHDAAPVAYRSPEFDRFMKAQQDAAKLLDTADLHSLLAFLETLH